MLSGSQLPTREEQRPPDDINIDSEVSDCSGFSGAAYESEELADAIPRRYDVHLVESEVGV